jgi:hypothetical protein
MAHAPVANLMLLQVAPEVFNRIEFGSVSRQTLNPEPAPALTQEFLDRCGAMNSCAVPDDQQLAGQMPQPVAKKSCDLETANGPVVELEVETPESQTADERALVPIKGLLQDRGLSARCPSPHAMRAGAQAAFVDEDDRATFPACFFLMAGHGRSFQCAI